MDESEKNYAVSVPEEYLGEVAGELTVRGAEFEGIDNDGGLAVIRARANPEAMEGFKDWLNESTGGSGNFDANA